MVRIARLRQGEGPATEELIEQVRDRSRPLRDPRGLDPLMERIGDARFVLLGEASHGTSEYYTWRAEISRRLIVEKGFSFLAVEGDWPACDRLDRYIQGFDDAGSSAREVLNAFDRWPTWMWANEEIAELADWLREHNRHRPADRQVGFHGLDVYSLWDSLYAVMGYLRRVDPSALEVAQQAFRCFEPYGEDAQEYARATARFVPESCEDEVIDLLSQMLRKAPIYRQDDREAAFRAEQNALIIKNAEAYYRTMIRGGPESWNIRDRHMVETLERLVRHYGTTCKAIVWEHNTHIGDARYTDMADEGMVNVGQLVRERRADEGVVLVGFSSHRGSVIAGRAWEAPWQRMTVPPGREGSWEDLLHRANDRDQLLIFAGQADPPAMRAVRGHRAIGVVYRPEYEMFGNYVPTVLPMRYDALLYIDETHALHPLDVRPSPVEEVPETFPSGR
ncbi:MAG: erythromycin esterase family protein [Isosphaeraceae bacterium]|nr:erythromycin esterase family protein [Isosphaeraceae bacterium]